MDSHWNIYNNNEVQLEKGKDNNIITYKERLTEGIGRKQ
jgi:hypothetical protein